MLSNEALVMLRPSRTYAALGPQSTGHANTGRGLAWRRPLFIALFIGACLSLAATGMLTVRIALSAALSWSFIPMIEVAALAIVVRGAERRQFGHVIDLFCAGFGPILLWTFGISVVTTVVPMRVGFRYFGVYLYAGAALALFWSLYIDYCFFRDGLGRSPTSSRRALLLHRALTWTPILLIFGQPGIVTEFLELTKR